MVPRIYRRHRSMSMAVSAALTALPSAGSPKGVELRFARAFFNRGAGCGVVQASRKTAALDALPWVDRHAGGGVTLAFSFDQESTVRFVHYLMLASTAVIAACGDDRFGPVNWSDVPDTLQIYSVSRPELLGMRSAVDAVFPPAVTVPVESGASWDFALAEQGGQFVMLPRSATENTDTTAAIATIGEEVTLDEVTEAPPNSEFVTQPVPIETGTVYVLRTRRVVCNQFTSLSGPRFGKLKAIAVDAEEGTYEFAVVVNPRCNDRDLVPPDDD